MVLAGRRVLINAGPCVAVSAGDFISQIHYVQVAAAAWGTELLSFYKPLGGQYV